MYGGSLSPDNSCTLLSSVWNLSQERRESRAWFKCVLDERKPLFLDVLLKNIHNTVGRISQLAVKASCWLCCSGNCVQSHQSHLFLAMWFPAVLPLWAATLLCGPGSRSWSSNLQPSLPRSHFLFCRDVLWPTTFLVLCCWFCFKGTVQWSVSILSVNSTELAHHAFLLLQLF